MRKSYVFYPLLLMLTAAVLATAAPSARPWSKKKKKVTATTPDTIPTADYLADIKQSGKMVTSTYPVRIRVMLNAVQIQSDYSQILPIYTQSGTFYMIARLNKGTNWVNGLPRGKYFINNLLITIN